MSLPRNRAVPDGAHRRVLDSVRVRGGSFREIAARLGDDPEVVYGQLEWLRRRSYVKHNGVMGVWWT